MQYGFRINARRCTGCKACVMACKDLHDLGIEVSFRQVYEYGGGEWRRDAGGVCSQNAFAYYVSVACNHCMNSACVKVCPTGAMHKDGAGLVSVDVQRCIGCGYCALSCPYRAPKVDRDAGHSVKCDGCGSRTAMGLRPVCVEACPRRALDFGPIDELVEAYGRCSDLPPLPDASATSPQLVVTLPTVAREDPERVAREGRVLNIREIV